MHLLRTASLTLEPQLASHAAEMFLLLSDPAIYEFEGEPPPSAAALEGRYRRLESRVSPDGSQRWLNWVLRSPDGNLVGCLQATVLTGGAAYVAYELGSRYWRRGYASEALVAVLEELESNYDVRQAFAALKRANIRSSGLLTKCGFTLIPDTQAPLRAEPDEVVMHKRLMTTSARHAADERQPD
ncbi:MAG: GNAT family N-acetyltransferase [Vicinamibacterales bacterium]